MTYGPSFFPTLEQVLDGMLPSMNWSIYFMVKTIMAREDLRFTRLLGNLGV